MLSGRHAGKKALVVKCYEEGNKNRKFANALVVGLARNPRTVGRRTSKKQFARRTSIKPFVKFVNFNHLMPTRYVVGDQDFKDLKDIKDESVTAGEKRTELTKSLRKALSDKYRALPDPKSGDKANSLRFLYRKLRF